MVRTGLCFMVVTLVCVRPDPAAAQGQWDAAGTVGVYAGRTSRNEGARTWTTGSKWDPFSELARLQRDQKSGFSIAKAIGVGLAAGVGAILTIFAIAVSLD